MISTPLVEGFDEVYKRNYTRLSQYAFHIIHDKGDAEDPSDLGEASGPMSIGADGNPVASK